MGYGANQCDNMIPKPLSQILCYKFLLNHLIGFISTSKLSIVEKKASW